MDVCTVAGTGNVGDDNDGDNNGGNGDGRSSTGVSQWYPYWRDYAKEQEKEGSPPIFSASETYSALSFWNRSEISFTVLNLTSTDKIELGHQISPGPLAFRQLLGAAVVLDPHEPGNNFSIFREYVQPYNFSRGAAAVSFITPTYERVRDELDSGNYATITLTMSTGTAVNATKLLFYSADCPAFGAAPP